MGLYGGGLFPPLCSLPEPASNPNVSLSMKICAPRKAGRTKRLSSFSFLWLACVANVSARVNARKLETEQKKRKHFCSLSLSASFRAIARAEMLARQSILVPCASLPVTHVSRSPVCEKRSGARGGRQSQNSSIITTSTQGRAQLKTFSVSIRCFTCFVSLLLAEKEIK